MSASSISGARRRDGAIVIKELLERVEVRKPHLDADESRASGARRSDWKTETLRADSRERARSCWPPRLSRAHRKGIGPRRRSRLRSAVRDRFENLSNNCAIDPDATYATAVRSGDL